MLRARMNFYGPKSGSQHTIAGRLIPVFEALTLAIDKAANQPCSEQNYSKSLPVWVHNICDQFAKTIFKKVVNAAPVVDNQLVPRGFGQLAGALLRGAVFFFKDAPARLKRDGLVDLPADQEKKVDGAMGLNLLFPIAGGKFGKDISSEDGLFKAAGQQLEKKAETLLNGWTVIAQYLWSRPVKEMHELLCGIPEGFAMVLDDEGEFATKSRRYEIYILLLMCWPEIAEMQAACPPKTRRDLLEWLDKQEGRQIVDDPKQFYEVCDDLDLDLAPPGHPRKAAL